MLDQYYGHKELYEVVLRAKTRMQFGERKIDVGEPVMYFDNVSMSLLSEQDRVIMARGGYGNMPRVTWEDRSEVTFQMIQGVMSSTGMGILMGANVVARKPDEVLYINRKEGPLDMVNGHVILEHWPVTYDIKKTFIFDYERGAPQKKLYGRRNNEIIDPFDPTKILPCLDIFYDKEF